MQPSTIVSARFFAAFGRQDILFATASDPPENVSVPLTFLGQ